MPLSKYDFKEKNLKAPDSHNIVTVEPQKKSTIESFTPTKLKDQKSIKYSEVSKPFIQNLNHNNARFTLDELARGPLSINDEEEKRIQSEVNLRLEEQLKILKEKVTKEAYNEGYSAGQKEAHLEVEKTAKPTLDSIQEFAKEFESLREEIFKANEEYLLFIVYHVAKLVILREIKEDKEYTKRLITQLLERLGTKENIKIFLGQEVYSTAEKLRSDLAQKLGQLKNITIELDPSLESVGCRVETDFGEVNASIAVQLENILNGLTQQNSNN